jgi:hypothetical protein
VMVGAWMGGAWGAAWGKAGAQFVGVFFFFGEFEAALRERAAKQPSTIAPPLAPALGTSKE